MLPSQVRASPTPLMPEGKQGLYLGVEGGGVPPQAWRAVAHILATCKVMLLHWKAQELHFLSFLCPFSVRVPESTLESESSVSLSCCLWTHCLKQVGKSAWSPADSWLLAGEELDKLWRAVASSLLETSSQATVGTDTWEPSPAVSS